MSSASKLVSTQSRTCFKKDLEIEVPSRDSGTPVSLPENLKDFKEFNDELENVVERIKSLETQDQSTFLAEKVKWLEKALFKEIKVLSRKFEDLFDAHIEVVQERNQLKHEAETSETFHLKNEVNYLKFLLEQKNQSLMKAHRKIEKLKCRNNKHHFRPRSFDNAISRFQCEVSNLAPIKEGLCKKTPEKPLKKHPNKQK